MAVHGTDNYVYYTDKILGAGSTGTVYFGRHKRKGDACAIKLFPSSTGSRTKTQVQENELEFMRRLQHKNIVLLLAIERDSKTSEVALIMELCSEGSLQKRLSEPEYIYGFCETDFLEFLKQFGDGLSYLRLYGISHRDIKPGNILCHKLEDGSIVYKITDFGSSCELLVEDRSKALYGTEEYLHPAVYRCIFIEKSRYGHEFELYAELWSIGVTLYQVAAGRLPFQVTGGRSNRETMYRIISKKPSGVISTIPIEGSGGFEESKDLPATCSFSAGFRMLIVQIIAGLLENDFKKQMTFDSFFPKCEELNSVVVVYVFCAITCVSLNVYLKPSETFRGFQVVVEKMSGISVSAQMFLFDRKRLTEIVKPDSLVKSFPRTSLDNPFILLTLYDHNLNSEYPQLGNIPAVPSDKDFSAEAVWSRDVTAFFIRAFGTVQSFLRLQQNLIFCSEWLILILRSFFKTLRERFAEIELQYRMLLLGVDLFKDGLSNRLADMDQATKSEKSSSSLQKTAKDILSKIELNRAKLSEQNRFDIQNIQRLRDNINMSFANVGLLDDLNPLKTDDQGCDSSRCLTKVEFNLRIGRTTYEQFAKDRKRQLSYNDDQIHKYEKIKLDQKVKGVVALISSHCLPYSVKLNELFRRFLSEKYIPHWNNLIQIERNLEKMKTKMMSLGESIHECYRDSNKQLDSLTQKLDPEQKDALKSSGYHSQPISGLSSRDSVTSESVSAPGLKSQLQLLSQCYDDNTRLLKNVQEDVRRNVAMLERIGKALK